MHIFIWSNVGRHMAGWPEAIAMLRDAGHDVSDPGPDDLSDARASVLTHADAVIVGTNPVTRTMIEGARRLTVIAKPGVGVDNIDLAAATENGVRVCNTPGANADAVADHALALALAVMRDIVRLDATTQRGEGWARWPFVGAQLAGARVAVLGTGNIGRGVVKRVAAGFGARVQAYDPYPSQDLQRDHGVTYLPLEEAVRDVDAVFVHVPLMEATRNLVNEHVLALMKPTAVLVNASRGGVVDEQALANAVREGRLAGAGVDVFVDEPARDGPLFGIPRIILTPHIGGYSGGASLRSRVVSAENILAAFAGRPGNQVNTADGVIWRATRLMAEREPQPADATIQPTQSASR